MKKVAILSTIMVLVCLTAWAMPFRPGLIDHTGYSRELGRYLDHRKEPGMDEPGDIGKLAPGDTVRAIVILIDFTDAFADTVNHPGWRYQQMLFDGPWPTQTMKEYYQEISYGDFTIIGEVTAIWYRANNGHDYYGYANGSARAAALVKEACQKADPDIDFSLYDRNNDGYVDALFVIHQGPGREETGNGNDIHSHRWRLDYAGVGNYTTGEGKICRDYSIEPEMHNSTTYSNIYNKIITIGVFAHEFGHIIGLPDLYDTDYSSDGLGNYCLMSGGSWGGNGQSPSRPVHMCAWAKAQKGWLTPENIPANVADKKLPPVETSRSVYKIWKNGTPGQQYFLVENRRRQGFDALLPNDGLLIYHVDTYYSNNSNDNRRLVDLESANADTANKDHLDVYGGSGADGNDYWTGLRLKTVFDPFSDADSRSNVSPYLTMVAAYNIRSGNADTMLLDFFVGGSHLTATSYRINDATGNNNGIAEEGETVGLTVTLTNTVDWLNATGITATLSTDDPSVTVIKSTASFPNINNGSSASCAADSFVFQVNPGVVPHRVAFILNKTASPESYDRTDTLLIPVGFPRVLLVDDDGGASFETYYRGSLDTLNVIYREWPVSSQGSPSLAKLDSFPVIVWFTGDDSLSTLTSTDTVNLKVYLDGGGKLFLSSKQLGQQLGGSGFYADYLHAQYVSNNANQRILRGVVGNPIGMNLGDSVTLGYTGGATNYQSMDIIMPINGADSCFIYRNDGRPGGITYEGQYKLVYLAFPFEAVGGPLRYLQRVGLMERILQWFGGVLPSGVEADDLWSQPSANRTISLKSSPNPVIGRMNLNINTSSSGQATVAIYNISGQRVATIFQGRLSAGSHRFNWEGRDDRGRMLPAGVYFVDLETAGGGRATNKFIKLQ